MPFDNGSDTVKGHLILGTATVIAALIGVATVFVGTRTGYWTSPNDTREFQKTRQNNARLVQENEGLRQENVGLR